jgi:N-glycosidase YbiA
MAIFFNTRGEQHGDFKNTSAHAFTLEGEIWQSAEHYVQAQRFCCDKAKARVRDSDYAFVGKAIARERPEALRADWEKVRDGVMEKAVRSKFASHPSLCAKLCATGDAEIIEASALSKHWGAGADGTGKNMLGRILMKIRSDLRASLQSTGAPSEKRLG